MSVKRLAPEELLALNRFVVDEERAHIELDKSTCRGCAERSCLLACPAGLYRVRGEEVSFDYAGCLECGTCRIVCSDKGVIRWSYPRGGFGVDLRCG